MVVRFDYERAATSAVAGTALILTAGVILELYDIEGAMTMAAVATGVFLVLLALLALTITATPWFENSRNKS